MTNTTKNTYAKKAALKGSFSLNIDPENAVDLLRWWHQHQLQMLNSEADYLRNTVLQEMFALRRQLETASQTQPHRYLTDVKSIYTLVENFANRLDPPYLHHSLPLALQHVVQTWQSKIQVIAVLPKAWDSDPPEQRQLLVAITQKLVQKIATAEAFPHDCRVTLENQSGVKALEIKAQYLKNLPSSLTVDCSTTLHPFLNTFQFFSHGTYSHNIQPKSLSWKITWQPQTNS